MAEISRNYRKLFITGVILCLGLLSVWFACSGLFVQLIPANPEQDTARLERLFPIVEKYQVHQFNNDYCKKIHYNRGWYVNTKEASLSGQTCDWYGIEAKLFDQEAAHDFQAIADAVTSSGAPLDWIDEVQFDGSGSIVYGHFYINCFWCNKRYVYSRSYVSLPRDVPENMWHKAINTDWYLVEESWH